MGLCASNGPVDEGSAFSVNQGSGRRRRSSSTPGQNTMRKFRTRSDFTLGQILAEYLVREAFIDYLRELFMEQHVYFWLDVQAFNKRAASADAEDKIRLKQDAEIIYHKYLTGTSPMSVNLDKATCQSIQDAIDGNHIEAHMFDLANEKVYQTLKFDYMPGFITSDRFMQLDPMEAEGIEKDASGNEVIESEGKAKIRHLEFFLRRPTGQIQFQRYLLSTDKRTHNYLCFWSEVEEFKLEHHNDEYKRRRGDLIIRRYLSPGTVVYDDFVKPCIEDAEKSNERMAEKFRKKASLFMVSPDRLKESNIDPKIFDGAAREVFKSMYAKSYRSFVSSDFFSQHKNNVFNEDDLNRTIRDLTRFASDRNLKKSLVDVDSALSDFHTVQANSTAILYFKRYLSREFSEQNIMFLQQVREFAAGDHIKPQFSTPLVVNRRPSLPNDEKKEKEQLLFKVPHPETNEAGAAGAAKPKTGSPRTVEVDDSMKARALKIYDKFVKNGSQFEINISSALREEVVKKIKSGKFDLHMFDNVYKEISDMIKKDAFPRFKKSKEYESYKKLAGAKMHLRKMTVSQMDFPIGVL